MHLESEWHWVKVTSEGDTVTDFESLHRKPYEILLLARCGKVPASVQPTTGHRCIFSVPSSLHSEKPRLGPVLAPFLPSAPTCMELFARCLTSGWTSWGNEVLLQQATVFRHVTSADTPVAARSLENGSADGQGEVQQPSPTPGALALLSGE